MSMPKIEIQQSVLDSRRHRPEQLEQLRLRQQAGIEAARHCAHILKSQFGVSRVVLFGSLMDPELMWWGSDIDLAVWDLPRSMLLKAGAAIEKGLDFAVDLVDVQDAKPHILVAIEQGLEL
jgi:uncharacterized protein